MFLPCGLCLVRHHHNVLLDCFHLCFCICAVKPNWCSFFRWVKIYFELWNWLELFLVDVFLFGLIHMSSTNPDHVAKFGWKQMLVCSAHCRYVFNFNFKSKLTGRLIKNKILWPTCRGFKCIKFPHPVHAMAAVQGAEPGTTSTTWSGAAFLWFVCESREPLLRDWRAAHLVGGGVVCAHICALWNWILKVPLHRLNMLVQQRNGTQLQLEGSRMGANRPGASTLETSISLKRQTSEKVEICCWFQMLVSES